jgi:hypothetical protein
MMTNAERVQFISKMNQMLSQMESIDMVAHMEKMLSAEHDIAHNKMKDQVHKGKTKAGN